MKKIYLIATLFLTACAAGKTYVEYDRFAKQTTQKYVVGRVTNKSSFGLLADITSNVLRVVNDNGNEVFYFNFATYAEGGGARSYPEVKAGCKAIILLNGQSISIPIHYDSIVNHMQAGLFAPGISETEIRVGPLTRSQMMLATGQPNMEFKIYGTRISVEGSIDGKDLLKIRQFMGNN